MGARYGWISVLLPIMLLYFCEFNEKSAQPEPPTGMVFIDASGKSFVQGSIDQFSNADERPAFKSMFAHDYCIDTTEITIAEYQRVMGKIPRKYDSIPQYNPQWPVCFITWYDAVSYCNRRSRIDGFDTVYSYSAVDSTNKGSIIRLHGLSTNLTAQGYRLPTEAEWEFAARAGGAFNYIWGDLPDTALSNNYAWSAHNSGGTPHPVAQLEKNEFGLYDMAGNVMEWVNDTKGTYPGSPVKDFVGARSTTGDYRPVKSGSFRHTIDRLRIANRSDNYETMSSTSGAYIGFRCAIGTINSGGFSGDENNTDPLKTVRLMVADINPVVSTRHARLAFVNYIQKRRFLCYVDFSVSHPAVTQFTDSSNVHNPAISPDGRWVAYATRDEGAIDRSQIYLRPLSTNVSSSLLMSDETAFNPRWWIDRTTNDTFIVFTNSAVINSDPSWPASVTKMQKISGGKPVGSSVVIESAGGYHDGRSFDGRYLATGNDRLRMKDLLSGETRILFTAPENGKDAGDTSQVCNVSISPGQRDIAEVMMLDFGNTSSGTITKRPYDVHEILFICNFDNQVTKWYAAPSGFVWSHPEWSNVTGFAATGLELPDGTHPSVGILGVQDGLYTEIVQGDNLVTPHLWIDDFDYTQIGDLARDSVGYYDEPPSHSTQASQSWKMALFWRNYKETEVYFTGTSHTLNGVDPRMISKYKSLNLSTGGSDFKVTIDIISNYILNHSPRVKLVAFDLLIGALSVENGDWTWSSGIANTRGYIYDKNHAFWTDQLPDYFTELVDRAPNADPLSPDSLLGYYASVSQEGWGEPIPPILPGAWNVDTQTCQENLRAIERLSQIASVKGVHLLALITPESPHYRELGYHGKYGATLETASEIINFMQNLQKSNTFFRLYDAHMSGLHDYTDTEAGNSDHLNQAGARKFTTRLDSLITEILQ